MSEDFIKRVLVLNTGGTIGMKANELTGKYEPVQNYFLSAVKSQPMFHDSESFRMFLPDRANEDDLFFTPKNEFGQHILARVVETVPLLDSANMNYSHWRGIGRRIADVYEDYDGFIVIHGTDTMAYTASYLSFAFQHLKKPVIFTGSQVPLMRSRNDAISNLTGALVLAAHFQQIHEVCLFFANTLFRANRVTKVASNSMDAFDSPSFRPLAKVGVRIQVDWAAILQAETDEPFHYYPNFDSAMTILKIFPGPFSTLRDSLKNVKGLIIQSFGAGNVPVDDKDLIDTLEEAVKAGIVVVNLSSCLRGNVVPDYATGHALTKIGVVQGCDLTVEAALTKLGILLAKHGDNVVEIRRLMAHSLCGELTEHEEKPPPILPFVLNALRKEVSNVELSENEDTIFDVVTSPPQDSAPRIVMEQLLPAIATAVATEGDSESLREIAKQVPSLSSPEHAVPTSAVFSPLHAAAYSGNVKSIEVLLDSGCDVNSRDIANYTPLMCAVFALQGRSVRTLVEHGAEHGLAQWEAEFILRKFIAQDDADGLEICFQAGLRASKHLLTEIAKENKSKSCLKVLQDRAEL